ncbi:MAG TPA: Clp protease N-terminal domain-containing protein [Pseudonocardiaceae bacterium]
MQGAPRLDDLIHAIEQRHPDGDPLRQLSDAVLLGEHLGELADHLIGHFVDRARRAGASWTLIGQSMGVTKQAAQKRFVPHEPTSPESGLQIFARYNDAARRAVVQGQQEAQRSGRDNIHPGHLLLGLVREPDTPVAAVLDAVGVAPEQVRDTVTEVLTPGGEPTEGPVPFTTSSKKALELAHRTALRLGHEYIGAEHLLLGVLSVDGDPEIDAVRELGLTGARAEAEIRRLTA